jgi:hypothetical protein
VLLDVRSYTGDSGVTFVAGQAPRHEFHDDRVIIESGEGLEVSIAPLSQNQAFSSQIHPAIESIQ